MDGQKNFSELFSKCEISGNLINVANLCRIEKAEIDKNDRSLKMSIRLNRLTARADLDELCDIIKETYKLSRVDYSVSYDGIEFSNDCFDYIVQYVRRTVAGANGFLSESVGTFKDRLLKIELKNGGYSILKARDCDKVIRNLVMDEFNADIDVEFCGKLELDPNDEEVHETQKQLMEMYSSEAQTKKPGRRAKNFKRGDIAEILSGAEIMKKPEKMANITPETGKITVEGRVFWTDSKAIRNGNILFLFDLTDLSGSVRIKMMMPQDKSVKFVEKIVRGVHLLISGEIEIDRYEKDVCLRPSDINILNDIPSVDEAEVKRVELHLHTNMSAMDGINDVGDYIERAAKWGHKAIAVTDHGGAQAFPIAMNAAKKHSIKMIYGIEAYFVNDMVPAVYGEKDLNLDAEFVVFDIETTGLNPERDEITEIGAVRIKGGEIVDSFVTFTDPEMPIPANIVRLTGIDDSMVEGAPKIGEALKDFYKFCKKDVLVAHNANFDMGFIKAKAKRCLMEADFTYIDTLPLCRSFYPELKKHRLDSVAEYLKILPLNHHRANDDAATLALIFKDLIFKLKEKKVQNIKGINEVLASGLDLNRLQSSHMVILTKNYTGLKNLYKLISFSHLKYFYKRPRTLKSLLMQYKDGLILGSACDAGELISAIVDKRPWDELIRIADFYDYLEVQPLGNMQHLIADGRVRDINDLMSVIKTVCRLGDYLKKPVVATGDAHFLDPSDEVYRRILMAGQGFTDADNQAPLYFRNTADMLKEFEYLGENKAYEIVVQNSNLVASWCENIRPVPKDPYPPKMEGAVEELVTITREKAAEIYGEPLPEIVEKRLDRELDSIIGHDFAVMYVIAERLVKKSMEDGYLVGSRGSVGSSLVAFLAGITEVNALMPHYVCKKCKHSEFIPDGYGTGSDMPDKVCPQCGEILKKDGFNIPFETFLGFDGDKSPDIDLNFSGDYQAKAHKYTEVLFGEGHVFRAGTIGTLAEKTAWGFVKKYLSEKEIVVSKAEENRLTLGCTGVRRTTGQHPGGVMIVPADKEIYDFCPIQRPADNQNTDTVTTHFEYHSLDQNLLKLDILGHDDPTMIKMLEDLTGIDARQVVLGEKKTMGIFSSTSPLGIEPDKIIGKVGTIAIPEFGTRFVRGMLESTLPTTFMELVNISGLSHGTDVWVNNAKDLIEEEIADLSTVISTRDDIMTYLISMGMPKKDSFTIMEVVRKGKACTPAWKSEWEGMMKECSVPGWYVDSCKKIKYMFPKAHAVAYVTMAFRIAYFKVYYPLAFYCAYFTVRADDFDAKDMIFGIDTVLKKIREIEKDPEATKKDEGLLTILEVCYEMYKRGIEFKPIDIFKSDATKFLICDGYILPPLNAIAGLGITAASAVIKAREKGLISTIEDLRINGGVSQSVIDDMRAMGILKDIPESSQLSLF